MKTLLLLLPLAVLPACAELIEGPRFVPYADDRFYIRSAPSTSDDAVTELAQSACRKVNKTAKLEKSEQYSAFDVRDDTYDCVGQ